MATAILNNDQRDIMIQEAIADLLIQALVDNSDDLSAEDRRSLLETIGNDKVLRKRYDGLIRQNELLRAWWAPKRSPALLRVFYYS